MGNPQVQRSIKVAARKGTAYAVGAGFGREVGDCAGDCAEELTEEFLNRFDEREA
jgi:hypothetical protein